MDELVEEEEEEEGFQPYGREGFIAVRAMRLKKYGEMKKERDGAKEDVRGDSRCWMV